MAMFLHGEGLSIIMRHLTELYLKVCKSDENRYPPEISRGQGDLYLWQ